MSIDDLLIGTIVAGVGLSGAYLRAEFVLHLRFKAAERRQELASHEVHVNRARPEQGKACIAGSIAVSAHAAE
jgi:hypothetical protein